MNGMRKEDVSPSQLGPSMWGWKSDLSIELDIHSVFALFHMAGLQYNFFPTDFYYPRPQSVPANVAARVAGVTVQTQKKEVSSDDLEWPKSIGFKVHQANNTQGSKAAGVSMHISDQNQDTAYVKDQGKHVKYSPNPLSWLTLISEELSDSS
ncbi:hypothetical protein REPUB_Repub02eG0169300 [Reevesia pubescens]